MIDVYAATGAFASKHDPVQLLAAAVMRWGHVPYLPSSTTPERRLVMPASTGSPIKTEVRNFDGLSIRNAESEPRDVSAIVLSPRPSGPCTFDQTRSRVAGEPRGVAAAAGMAGLLVHRSSTVRAVSFTARSPRLEQGSRHG